MTKVGNACTCGIQGYLIYFGFLCTFLYHGSLWIYYCCSIAFEISDEEISGCIEPVLHLIPLVCSSISASFPFFANEGYIGSSERPYCAFWRNSQKLDAKVFIAMSLFTFVLISVCISLILILHKVWLMKRRPIPASSSISHGTTAPNVMSSNDMIMQL